MSWFVLSLIGMLAFSFANIAQKALMDQPKSDPNTVAGYFQLLVALFFLPLALNSSFTWVISSWPYLLIMATIYVLLNLLLYRAFQLTSAAEVSILSATRPLWVALAGSFVLNEPLFLTKIIGIVLIFTSTTLVFYQKGSLRYHRGQLLALLTGFVGAAGFIIDGFNLKTAPVYAYSFLAFLLPS